MKFLLTTTLSSFRAGIGTPAYIHYSDAKSDLSVPLTSSETVDVWICDGEEVTGDLLDKWFSQASQTQKSMLVRDAGRIPRLQDYSKGRLAEISPFPEKTLGISGNDWEASVLSNAEMLYAKARAKLGAQKLKVGNARSNPQQTSILLVGAGIMNLLSAQLLAERGYKVRVVDQGPDPRFCQRKDWTSLGVTSGGHNARMFTRTEADNYNEQDSKIYRDMQSIFRRTVRNGGWSVKPPTDFTAAENAWVDAFERVPDWMAATFKKDIHEVNGESGKIWQDLMNNYPQLFKDVGFHEDIIRMYVEVDALNASITLYQKLGSLSQAPSPQQFLEAYPAFRPAAELGHLAGGIIVDGFTVNIHLFVAKLIGLIADLGGEFVWNCKVHGVERNLEGEVITLRSEKGDLQADHYIVSPGTSGGKLLEGSASENLVQGVLGIWLQIPNLEPKMRNSMKIHRRDHKVEDINITVAKDSETGEDILIFGGGYGYVGLDRPAPDSAEMTALYDELEEVARIYFPQGYTEAKKRGPTAMYPGGHRKFCIRPFTPTGLGIFERIPTASGGQLIITGGNNTGGFAQAPAIARAVLRSLNGEDDPIHVLFHPDRGKLASAVPALEDRALGGRLQVGIDDAVKRRQPLKLLLLCSDGPQHRYLRYRLDQTFPGYYCIQETSEGQVRQLMEKGRTVDAFWQRYQGVRRHLFGHDVQRKAHFDRLIPVGHVSPEPNLVVDSVNCKEVWDAVEKWKPDLTIVSGTKYIGKKLNARGGLMINMHMGHLPDYKGNHCIFFALYDGAVDKVGATLHQLTPSLDGGDLLEKVSVPVFQDDNEETLYTRCLETTIDRCMGHIERFLKGEKLVFLPQKAEGRMFRHRDRTPDKEMWLWWMLNVGGLLKTAGKKA
ncbi:Methionyl-tRNA formyltransferase [Paramyrothecium foliicola]|nr:Methionyl-tRNA formyltransferase [Paramyrothecium foliicola]